MTPEFFTIKPDMYQKPTKRTSQLANKSISPILVKLRTFPGASLRSSCCYD
jgi:hypothetical protein